MQNLEEFKEGPEPVEPKECVPPMVREDPSDPNSDGGANSGIEGTNGSKDGDF